MSTTSIERSLTTGRNGQWDLTCADANIRISKQNQFVCHIDAELLVEQVDLLLVRSDRRVFSQSMLVTGEDGETVIGEIRLYWDLADKFQELVVTLHDGTHHRVQMTGADFERPLLLAQISGTFRPVRARD